MKILGVIVSVIVLLFITGYLLVSFYAVKFIQARIREALGPDFSIAAVHMTIRELSIEGITCNDPVLHRKTLDAKELKIVPSLRSLLKGKIVITSLTLSDPFVFVTRSAKGAITGPWSRMPAGKTQERPTGKPQGLPVTVDKIEVKNGSIDFDDRMTGSTPALIRLRNLECTVGEISMPPQAGPQTTVHLQTVVKGPQKDGTAAVSGWTDLATGDQATSLKVTGVEIKTFEPYYRKKIPPVKSGYATMNATINIRNQILDAPGELDLNQLSFDLGGPLVTSLMGMIVPSNTLVARLQEKNNALKIPFRIHGNEKNPKFSFQNAFLAEVAVKMVKELGIQPGLKSLVPGLVPGVDSIVRSTIRNLFNEIK